MQIIPCKPCTETLVSRNKNQNQGIRTGTVKPQEPSLQYRNRDWTEKSVSPQRYKYSIDIMSWLRVAFVMHIASAETYVSSDYLFDWSQHKFNWINRSLRVASQVNIKDLCIHTWPFNSNVKHYRSHSATRNYLELMIWQEKSLHQWSSPGNFIANTILLSYSWTKQRHTNGLIHLDYERVFLARAEFRSGHIIN